MCALAPAHAEKRVALVIGNGAYVHADKLANPVNDARGMRDALTALRFDVTYGEDLDLKGLRRMIGRFAGQVDGADVALVYFAGHGATFGDAPYVIPVDAEFARLDEMHAELVTVEELIGDLRRAKSIRIAILDACRDNAAEQTLKKSRGGAPSRGLAPPKNPSGMIIAYATQHGATAADSAGSVNSPFTAALLRNIAKPGLDVKDMFFKVGSEVGAATGGRQRPEISISMYEPYALMAAVKPDAGPSDRAAVSDAERTWGIVQNTTSVAVLDDYISRFGDVPIYGKLARAKREELAKVAEPPPGAAPLTAGQERALKPKDSFKECAGCPEMMVVPAGSFTMGSPASEKDRSSDEGPQHNVTIGKPFAVGKFHVTVDQFEAFMREMGLLDAGRPSARDDSSLPASMLDKILDLNGHLLVQPLDSPLTDWEPVATRVSGVPGVRFVAPVVESQAVASSPFNANGVLVRGIRGADLARLRSIANNVQSGALDGFDQGQGIAIGQRLAEQLSLTVGDNLTLVSPNSAVTPMGMTPRIKAYRIAAIFKLGISEYDAGFVFMPLKEAQAYFNRSGDVTAIEIYLNKPDRVDAFRRLIADAAGRPVFIIDWRQRYQAILQRRCSWRSPGFAQNGTHPVVCVNWDEAKAYADWLAKKTGKPYRLLSEAEWEYAARGRTSPGAYPRFWFGDDERDLCRYGNFADQKVGSQDAPCNDGYDYTSPAGHYAPNAFGLYDMFGNAWQWTADCYHDSYNGAPLDGSVWTSGSCGHVIRGGSWYNHPGAFRAANRGRDAGGDDTTGFRVARMLISAGSSGN
jgi:formylglycine-generating enzyme required for sulfatase activity